MIGVKKTVFAEPEALGSPAANVAVEARLNNDGMLKKIGGFVETDLEWDIYRKNCQFGSFLFPPRLIKVIGSRKRII